MKSLAEVITFLTTCRDSHVNQPRDKRFHAKCVEDYDEALAVLRKIKRAVG